MPEMLDTEQGRKGLSLAQSFTIHLHIPLTKIRCNNEISLEN
jgi:hypothetical protein